MFTGIIKNIGYLCEIEKNDSGAKLKVEVSKKIPGISLGSSVCTDGVCLTLAKMSDKELVFDVMNVTLGLTTLGKKIAGQKLNLEPSLTVGSEVGGHFVYGHVDGTATVKNIKKDGEVRLITFAALPEILRYLPVRASVAINGVSLTVAVVDQGSFTVSLVQFTLMETNLGDLKVGDEVNIECDMLAKYLENFTRSTLK
jgi:riboflavin synthase